MEGLMERQTLDTHEPILTQSHLSISSNKRCNDILESTKWHRQWSNTTRWLQIRQVLTMGLFAKLSGQSHFWV